MATMTESEIRRQVKDYLAAKGWFCFHVLQGLGAYKGITDLIAAKNSRIVFIELKTKTGKQSDYQKQFQSDLEAAGGEYILCRGIDDLMERGI
jgi:Holliday junction resolvase-like predicted endonuclease